MLRRGRSVSVSKLMRLRSELECLPLPFRSRTLVRKARVGEIIPLGCWPVYSAANMTMTYCEVSDLCYLINAEKRIGLILVGAAARISPRGPELSFCQVMGWSYWPIQ